MGRMRLRTDALVTAPKRIREQARPANDTDYAVWGHTAYNGVATGLGSDGRARRQSGVATTAAEKRDCRGSTACGVSSNSPIKN